MELKPLEFYLTYNHNDLTNICEKLKEWDSEANTDQFYAYMKSGLVNQKVYPFVAYNSIGDIIACAVLSAAASPMYIDSVLYIQWVWIDPHYPSLWKKGMKFLYEICKQFGIKKITGNTRRLPEAFQRKFGFIQTDAIIEKEVI